MVESCQSACVLCTQLRHTGDVRPTCDKDKPESFEHFICDHVACHTCITRYIKEHIARNSISIPCPGQAGAGTTGSGVACVGVISYYDINRIDQELAKLYKESLISVFPERPALSDMEDRPSQCPDCRVYVYMYDGCDIIYCICGYIFCSVCEKSYVTCCCGVASP